MSAATDSFDNLQRVLLLDLRLWLADDLAGLSLSGAGFAFVTKVGASLVGELVQPCDDFRMIGGDVLPAGNVVDHVEQ